MNNQIQLVLKSSTTELSLNDHELGIYLTPELDGLTGLPEIRTTSGVNAGYDGGWTSAQNYDARSITIRGVIANEDVATVEQLRRQLTTLAGQGKNEELTLDLVTQAGKAYTIQVRTIALEMSLQKVLTQQEFMLQLRADDPLIYDASETGHEALLQVAQATGGFTIDFELPLAITGSSEETVVNNEGLEQVPTITRMYGALHNPKIINQTTNQFMQIEADLGFAEGDWIEPSEVVSGEDITINGAPEGAPLSSVQIEGNTSQQTYTGKNLVYTKGAKDGGITATYNATTGTTTVSGTAVRTYAVFGVNSSNIPAGTYTLSIQSAVSAGVGIGIRVDGGSRQAKPISVGSTKYTFTTSGTITSYDIYLTGLTAGRSYSFSFQAQLEAGSSATSFEPYVGGIPAPNPDYPQDIRVVTGENVVKITGKNLLDIKNNLKASDGGLNFSYSNDKLVVSGTPTRSYANVTNEINTFLAAGQYTLSLSEAVSHRVYIWIRYTDGTAASLGIINAGGTSATTTFAKDVAQIRLDFSVITTGVALSESFSVQLEKGSSSSSFEPYQEQSYPISLGSIELCKIGDYQDYIYKSDGKWYVHKETGKRTYTADDITIAASDTYSNVRYAQFPKGADNKQNGNYTYGGIINFFTHGINMGATPAGGWNSYISDGLIYNSAMQDNYWCSFSKSTILSTMKEKLNGMVAYYVLANPTDTEITNEELVAQLEALAAATMYNPQTNIATLYAEGNEQPMLDVSYFTDKNPDTRDELVIDSRLRTITLNGLDVYHLQAPGSEFLMLAPGENRLALQSDITGDNGYAQVSYKQGYLSI